MSTLLRLTNSLKVELIPYDNNHLEKKSYNWTISAINESKIKFNFKFDHPEYISVNGVDIIFIIFENADFFLQPQSKDVEPLPNGWRVKIHLRPQLLEEGMREKAIKATDSSWMVIISTNALLTFIFGVTMQPMFDMINSLQITAMLPLTNVLLPANVMTLYEPLV